MNEYFMIVIFLILIINNLRLGYLNNEKYRIIKNKNIIIDSLQVEVKKGINKLYNENLENEKFNKQLVEVLEIRIDGRKIKDFAFEHNYNISLPLKESIVKQITCTFKLVEEIMQEKIKIMNSLADYQKENEQFKNKYLSIEKELINYRSRYSEQSLNADSQDNKIMLLSIENNDLKIENEKLSDKLNTYDLVKNKGLTTEQIIDEKIREIIIDDKGHTPLLNALTELKYAYESQL